MHNTSALQGHVHWSRDGFVATVVISNPGHLNILSMAMWQQLHQCFREISAISDLRCVVLQGDAGAFSAGADISEFPAKRSTREQVRSFHDQTIAPCLAAIAHCVVPTVAAIDGPCIGGGLEVASVCDIRIASDRSTFGLPIHRLGFSIAPAEAAVLLALLPKSVVLELLLEGRILEADEAFEKGLVSRLVAAELWQDEVAVTVSRICSGAPSAVRRSKWLIQQLSESLQTQPEGQGLSPLKREVCWDFVDSQDYERGVTAFLNKTTPAFQGD